MGSPNPTGFLTKSYVNFQAKAISINEICSQILNMCHNPMCPHTNEITSYINLLKVELEKLYTVEIKAQEVYLYLEDTWHSIRAVNARFLQDFSASNCLVELTELIFILGSIKLRVEEFLPSKNYKARLNTKIFLGTTLTKAIKYWIKNKNYIKAENYHIAYSNILDDQNAAISHQCVIDAQSKWLIERHKVFLLLCHADLLSRNDKLNTAVEIMENLKNRVVNFPTIVNSFSILSYKMGLQCRKERKYSSAITLFRSCFETGRFGKLSSTYLQNCLKSLTTTYIAENSAENWDKALHALDLAYAGEIDSSYLVTALKTTFICNKNIFIREVMQKATMWKSIDFKTVQELIAMLFSRDCYMIALDFSVNLRGKFLLLSQKVHLFMIELVIIFIRRDLKMAKETTDNAETILSTETDVTFEDANNICQIIVEHACEFRSKKFDACLKWYDYCFAILHKIETESNEHEYKMLSLLKNICYCCEEDNCTREAKKVLSLLKKKEVNNLAVSYLVMKTAMSTRQQDLINEALNYFRNNCESYFKILVKLGKAHKVCVNLLKKCADERDFPALGTITNWFAVICWNIGLKEKNSEILKFSYFYYCCRFLEIMGILKYDVISHRKVSLLLAITSGLNAVDLSKDVDRKNFILSKVMLLITECRYLNQEHPVTSELHRNFCDFLFLYEFKAKALKKDPTVIKMFYSALEMPELDSDSFQIISAILMINGIGSSKVRALALKVAIAKELKREAPNYTQISMNYIVLIQVLSNVDDESLTVSKEIFNHCVQYFNLIKKNRNAFSDDAILCLITKCWIFGIRCVTVSKAHQWCSLAIRVSKELPYMSIFSEENIADMLKKFF